MPVRTVGEYLERWGYAAKVPPSCQEQDPRRSAIGWRSPLRQSKRGPPVRMRRSTGATRPARRRTSNRDGLRARGGRRGSRYRFHIRMNLISTISNEGSVDFMTYKETMTAALFIRSRSKCRETTRKIFLIVDRLRAHEAKKVNLGRGASGSDRAILSATVSPRAECGQVPEQDMKGWINATGLPGSQK